MKQFKGHFLMKHLVDSLISDLVGRLQEDTNMLDKVLVKIDITTLLQRIMSVRAFRLAKFSRCLTLRFNCAIPQINSFFALLCGKKIG